MCGIVGKYFFDRSLFHDEDLDGMLRSIIHRGPDSEGRYSDGRVLFGFRRLSIIDVESGNQPLFNEDGQVIALVNGEIYNFKELKRYLQGKGHEFRTGSDCEVIVHLYEELGQEFVEQLNGMFAFCLYDRKKETLLLGRDRVGIKPLYFAKRNGVLIFASEIKAIPQAKEIDPAENSGVLDEYLCFRCLSGSRTFFSGIELLLPGELIEVSPKGIALKRYWQPSFRDPLISGDDAVHLIKEKMHDSIRRQLMADVPLGTQLSGGVDSSWVSFLASREVPRMKSFSIGFAEKGYDETDDAKIVARKGGLEYHEIVSDANMFAKSLPRIIWHNDEPLTHANSVEIYNLCCYAREHVKVLLTGEGADELFGGYPRYYICRLGEYYDRIPSLVQPVFRYGLDLVSRGREKKPSFFLGMSPRDLVFWNSAFADPEKVAWLMDKRSLELAERKALLEKSWRDSVDLLDNLLIFEFQSYLQPILLRQDKMSMGASIESRVPILDNVMVDLAFSIPAKQKIRNLKPKYLFKRAAARDLPSKIVYKRKVGFGVPVGVWMRDNGSLVERLSLLQDERRNIPGVNPTKLERIIREHCDGLVDHQDILWPLLNYVLWRNIFSLG